MASRRKTRSGGGATNKSNDVSHIIEGPGGAAEVLEVPRTKSRQHPGPSDTADADGTQHEPARPQYTPDRRLGESYQEANTHDSWRGFPRKGSQPRTGSRQSTG